jgi:iron complex outermembrane receptor protein
VDSAAGGTAWLLKGDAFHSTDDLLNRPSGEFTDLALQGRLTRVFGNDSRLDLQSYYRREFRRIPGQLTHAIDVVDLDVQHATTWGDRHDIVWGGGVRRSWDETEGSAALRFDPEDRSYALSNVFVQDEYALVRDRLYTTAGIKYEHNAFSGGELQPNVRARLMLDLNQVVWGAVARAVRRPTRLDDDPLLFAPGGALVVRGTHEFRAEQLVATEFGYRVQPLATASFDATVFWHDYDDLRSQDLSPQGGLPLTIGNTLEGRSRGVELAGNVQPAPWLRVHAGYARIDTGVARQPGSRDATGGTSEINDPDHLFTLRTSVDLPRRIELDAVLRSVAALPNPAAPGYTELTLRAGWRMTDRVELSVVGEDLLHDHHREAGSPGYVEFERSVRAGVTLRY